MAGAEHGASAVAGESDDGNGCLRGCNGCVCGGGGGGSDGNCVLVLFGLCIGIVRSEPSGLGGRQVRRNGGRVVAQFVGVGVSSEAATAPCSFLVSEVVEMGIGFGVFFVLLQPQQALKPPYCSAHFCGCFLAVFELREKGREKGFRKICSFFFFPCFLEPKEEEKEALNKQGFLCFFLFLFRFGFGFGFSQLTIF